MQQMEPYLLLQSHLDMHKNPPFLHEYDTDKYPTELIPHGFVSKNSLCTEMTLHDFLPEQKESNKLITSAEHPKFPSSAAKHFPGLKHNMILVEKSNCRFIIKQIAAKWSLFLFHLAHYKMSIGQ